MRPTPKTRRRRVELHRRRFRGHQLRPETLCVGVLLAIPAEVLARYPYAGRFSVKSVQRRDVLKNDISDLGAQEWRGFFACDQK